MITIEQNVGLAFHHVDVKDAVIMAPLMNRLAECIAQTAAKEIRDNLPNDKKALYNNIHSFNANIIWYEAEAIFNILSAIGFVATEEYSADNILAKHLKKD